MTETIDSLREEVAALRAEVKELQKTQRWLLEQVGGETDEDGKRPEFLHIEASCLAVRSEILNIPLIMRAEGDDVSLDFLDANRRLRMCLSMTDGVPRIEMRNAEGKLTTLLTEANDGTGQFCVCDPEGHPRAGMRVLETGGLVNVVSADGKPQAALRGDPVGGSVFTTNSLHRMATVMRATEIGGHISVHEPSGQIMGFLAASPESGHVSVYGPQGALAAGMAATEHGGGLVCHDVEGKPIAHFPRAEDSDGESDAND